jgi:hypothetical protein
LSTAQVARLGDITELLEGADYEVEHSRLAELPAILAESPYAVVGCIELADWTDFSQNIADVQTALTHAADEVPSVCSRDLYLVVHVLTKPSSLAEYAALAAAAADTQYVRKLVRVAINTSGLDRALRALLPLRPATAFDLVEPLQQLRDELRALELEDRVADAAIDGFREQNEVRVL